MLQNFSFFSEELNLICKGLVTNYGEGGGHVKFYPYEKGGGKSFSHSEGGAQKVLGLF